MHHCDKGLVLRAVDWREADQMLTILTECNGKVSAVARGVRRKSSRISAAVQNLAYSDFTLFESGGRFTVNEAEPIELFYHLREDLEKLALASYFAEVLETAADAEIVNPELLRLGLNALYALSSLPKDPQLIKAAFEFKVAALSGYTPRLGRCPVCGSTPGQAQLHLPDGAIHCTTCPLSGKSVFLPAGAHRALAHIIESDVKRVFSFSLEEESLRALARASEEYLAFHFDRGFRTLSFYKSLVL